MNCIYTDGACSRNGFPGARASWAFWHQQYKYSMSGLVENEKQTCNTGELIAIKKAIEYAISKNLRDVIIYSDSSYAIGSIRKWRLTKKKKNYELISSIIEILRFFPVSLNKIRGHSGIEGNEIADDLAQSILYGSKYKDHNSVPARAYYGMPAFQ